MESIFEIYVHSKQSIQLVNIPEFMKIAIRRRSSQSRGSELVIISYSYG